MGTSMSKNGRRDLYSVRKAAWVLNTDRSTISRAIRTGALRTVPRDGRPFIPVNELTRLLSAAQNGGRK